MDNPKVKAQVSLEFVVTFVMLVLFVVLVAKMFAWFGARMVSRHNAYEATRSMTLGTAATGVNFFNEGNGKKPMNVFNENN
jgi:uncharacterized protein (UPF0333 family)